MGKEISIIPLLYIVLPIIFGELLGFGFKVNSVKSKLYPIVASILISIIYMIIIAFRTNSFDKYGLLIILIIYNAFIIYASYLVYNLFNYFFKKKNYEDIDILSLSFILILFLGTLIAWFKLPNEIPNHIDSYGNIKDYTSKNFIFFFSILGSSLSLLILKLSKYPKIYNYTVEITDENKDTQYNIASKAMKTLAFQIVLVFIFLEYIFIYSKNAIIIIILLVASIFINLFYYIKKASKYRGSKRY